MSSRKVYLESFGCQMNAFDTEVLEAMLAGEGFGISDDPSETDVILVNTCSVRENAERRAIGRLNDLSRHKGTVLAVCGCMAQRLGNRLFKLVPALDIVAGPDTYSALPSAISAVLSGEGRKVLVEEDSSVTYRLQSASGSSPTRYLSITRGCENYCSYCIVPYVRGKVRSKEAADVIEDLRLLAASGAKEVTLLGQNVMAYHSGNYGFTALLEKILLETEIERIRFLTTHPRDVEEGIFRLMSENSRVCPHIHLPFQAGSDRVLARMNRGYTRSYYLSIIDRAREIRPDISFTTDVIVGFPGETDGDFQETLEIIEKVRFDSAFTFKYSPREGTRAEGMEDNVPSDVKKERLETLNSVIQRIRREIMSSRLGSIEEILLDASVKKGEYHFLKGRTPHFRNVLIGPEKRNPGDIISVVLKELSNFTFIGEEITGR
ncbi:MAG: tRNA (N6-isopentenyl adenosine(37)-C2)-methylthiotransferase MiaB [Candidatus Fermentibacteria bacterium]